MTDDQKRNWGGKRKGAGRKSLEADGGETKAFIFRVPKAIKNEMMKRGGSEWLRQVIAKAITE